MRLTMCSHLALVSASTVEVMENLEGAGVQLTETTTSESVFVSQSTSNVAPNKSEDAASGTALRLPEEILTIIFDDVVTSESSSCHCQCKGANSILVSPPRRLAQVCRAWRETIFSCPVLWRNVHLAPFYSITSLEEGLSNSSPFPIHIVVHQWPFQNPIPASGPLSITTLTAQLHSILSPTETDPMAACSRVRSVTINGTECSTFINFVLQTWTGRGSKFPALRRVSMNGNLCATWSRACFFDGKNASGLEILELTNVMISHNIHRLSWGIGLNLTTLVWSAPPQKDGSLIISVTVFHHIVSSFPSLTTLEMHGQVLSLDSVTPASLVSAEITPFTHIDVLRVRGNAFTNPNTAFLFLFFFPSLKHLVIRGRSCTGPITSRTISHVMSAFIQFPCVLPRLEDLDLESVDVCEKWSEWALEELERWKWKRSMGYQGRSCSRPSARLAMIVDEALYDTEKGDVEA